MTNKRPFKRCTVVCFNEDKIATLKKQLPSEKDLRASARRHKVLGHPARQAILHLLGIDECCVCDIAEVLGKPVSTVSQHLRMLVSEGVLEYRQEGKLVFYYLAQDASGVVDQKNLSREAIR
ncbi:MAG: ArsR/SmtB family transcription factor [Chromatocurvus sp.]